MADPTVAAIDCGTNTTRLLVARTGDDGRLEALEREVVITRLGAGVDATGRLDPEAVARTVVALRRFRALLDRHGVERVRMTATSAARDAADAEAFFDVAEEVVGVRPELLGGEEEGRLTFRGRHARPRSRRGAVHGRRHRRRVDRVRRRPRRARGRHVGGRGLGPV